MKDTALTYQPVAAANWKALQGFFEEKGGPQYCWCMAWRPMAEGKERSKKADRKSSLKSLVDDNIPVGLIFYFGKEIIAWCSIAPREQYSELGGDESLEDVWSLVCFFIKKEHRGRGMTERLIPAALEYAKTNGAKYVEAYPVDTQSPSYRFMGYKSTFRKIGFQYKKKAGTRRNVMVLKV